MNNFNLILASLIFIPGFALADTTPDSTGAASTSTPVTTPAPAKDPCCGVKISGYIDGSYNYLESANQFTSGDFDRAFDIEENGLTLQQLAVTVAYQPENGFGGLVNPMFGRDAKSTASFGYDANNGNTDIGYDVLQVFLQYAKGSFTIIAGKFVTLVGEETIDPTNNTNFSRSLLFAFATPDTHTGMRGTYVWNDKLKFILGINDGWNNIRDWGRGKTIEYGIAYNPNAKLSLSAQGYTGEERVVSKTATGSKGQRTLIDLIASYNATDKLTLATNFDYGKQNNAFLVTGENGNATWIGIAAYLNYKFNDTWRVSLRGEDFDDRNGYRTGVDQTIKELTFTVGFAPIKNLEFRGETRRDFSNVNSYTDRDSNSLKKFQQSFALEAVYKFSNAPEVSTTTSSTPITNDAPMQYDEQKNVEQTSRTGENITDQEKYLLSLDKGSYTVQLLGSSNEEKVKMFIQHHALENKASYFHTQRAGKDWYVVVYGDYPSLNQAKQALHTMPDSLKKVKLKPWVRSLKNIHEDINKAK